MSATIPTQTIPSVEPSPQSPRSVRAELEALINAGAALRPAGDAADRVDAIWDYPPRYRVDLFGTRFYLAEVLQNPAVRFFVSYVVTGGAKPKVSPRIFYKDVSLIWRVASHIIITEDSSWIGKGDLVTEEVDGYEVDYSDERTTDLPLEMQNALEALNRSAKKVKENQEALFLFLRNAPVGRLAPYADFTKPRRQAAMNRRNLIHGGKSIARFRRKNDPSSLTIVKGFEPDFRKGLIDHNQSSSVTYGGAVQRFRFLSTNKRIQWFFFASPTHVWVAPPQALTTELSTYGVRTITVDADENIFIPGFEYHWFGGDDPAEHFTQIPAGFAGPQSEHDESRADASPWIEAMPLVKEFRKKVL